MIHQGDYIVSISKLTKWMGRIAKELGVEVLTGFAAGDIILDKSASITKGVKLVQQYQMDGSGRLRRTTI
jgi:electron-transferring-flavoprotein dehydrogenase